MRIRIIVSSACFLALTVVIVTLGLLSVRWVTANQVTMYEDNFPGISLLLNIDRDLQQALVAERSMLTTDDSEELDALNAVRNENLQQAEDRWNQYKALPSSSNEKTAIAAYEKAFAGWTALSDQVVTLAREGTIRSLAAARVMSLDAGTAEFEAARGEIDGIGNRIEEATLVLNNDSTETEKTVRVWQIIAAGVAVLMATGISTVLVSMLLSPVRGLTLALKDIAQGEGDLTVRLNENSDDEMAEAAKWFNVFMSHLEGLMRSITQTALEVAANSDMLTRGAEESARVTEQMAETTQQIASASQDQSLSSTRTAAAVDQLNAAIASVVQGTDSQARGARESASTAATCSAIASAESTSATSLPTTSRSSGFSSG